MTGDKLAFVVKLVEGLLIKEGVMEEHAKRIAKLVAKVIANE